MESLQICSFVVTISVDGTLIDSAAWAGNPAAFLALLFPLQPCLVLPLNLKSCWPLNSLTPPVQAPVICLWQWLPFCFHSWLLQPIFHLECSFKKVNWMSFSYLKPINSSSLDLGGWLPSRDLAGPVMRPFPTWSISWPAVLPLPCCAPVSALHRLPVYPWHSCPLLLL